MWCFHGSVCQINAENFCILGLTVFFYRQKITCVKRFTRYGRYAGEVEDIIIGKLAVVS